jgi:hypothetical protein
MLDCPSVHTSISRKMRKEKLDSKRNKRQCIDTEKLDSKRNKRQCIDTEDGIQDKESLARHKRYLILKQRKDSKCARMYAHVISQECNGGSSSNDISFVEIYVSSQENSESSRSNINSMGRYVTIQEQNNESSSNNVNFIGMNNGSSSNDMNSIGMNNESSSSNVTDHLKNNESLNSNMESVSVNSEIWNFRKPTFKCRHCNALLWYEERSRPNTHTKTRILESIVKMER